MKRALRIGITPLTDAAPLVAAQERGFFAAEGLAVELSLEPSWANIRDKLAAGVLDAAHMLAPMPIAATLGVGPLHEPMGTALALGLGGNAITVSGALAARMAAAGDAAPDGAGLAGARACATALARVVAQRRAAGEPPLRLATVFPVSMHSYALRLWLAAAGLSAERDVRLLVVPPPRMVEELEAGAIDGFCVGEPWSSVAVRRGSGVLLLTGNEIWQRAPEKVLGVTAAFAARHPETHRALLRAALRAARWCDEPAHRPELAELLAGARYLDLPLETLQPALVGAGVEAGASAGTGSGAARAASRPPALHEFHAGGANFPWRSHAAWIVAQMLRWGELEKAVDVRAAAARVYWTDLHREVAADVEAEVPECDEKLEQGFFDGTRFDPRDVVAHLRAPSVHELRVPLDELAQAQRAAE